MLVSNHSETDLRPTKNIFKTVWNGTFNSIHSSHPHNSASHFPSVRAGHM